MENSASQLIQIELIALRSPQERSLWHKYFKPLPYSKLSITAIFAADPRFSTMKMAMVINPWNGVILKDVLEGKRRRFPRTHGLFKDTTDAFGYQLRYVAIDKFINSTFKCTMYYINGEKEIQLNPTVTDALTIAEYHKAPIYITKEILEQVGEVEPTVGWHA